MVGRDGDRDVNSSAINLMTIKGFKGFQSEARIPLRPLTIIMGENNSGKSAILKALASLAQTKIYKRATGVTSDWVSSGPWFDLGSDETYINNKSKEDSFSIGFSSENFSFKYEFNVMQTDRFACDASKITMELAGSKYSIVDFDSMPKLKELVGDEYSKMNEAFGNTHRILTKHGVTEDDILEANESIGRLSNELDNNEMNYDDRLKIINDFCQKWNLQIPLPKQDEVTKLENYIRQNGRTPPEYRDLSSNFSISMLLGGVMLVDISPIAPENSNFRPIDILLERQETDRSRRKSIISMLLTDESISLRSRHFPDVEYHKLRRLFRSKFFENLERLIDSEYLGAFRLEPKRVYNIRDRNEPYYKTMQILCTSDQKSLRRINKSLKELVNVKIFPKSLHENSKNNAAQFYEVTVGQRKDTANLHLSDVGYGISQLLPILSHLNSENTLILEEAESNLHPKAQSKLMEIIVKNLDTKSLNPQIIMESHSEHFLLRIQQLIADGSFNDEHVALIFVRRDEKRGTIVHHAETHNGEFLETLPESFSFYENSNPTGSII